jgi:hypothetical protein
MTPNPNLALATAARPQGPRFAFTSLSLHGVPELLTTYAPDTETSTLSVRALDTYITLVVQGPAEAEALASALSRAARELRRMHDLPEASQPSSG